MTHKFHRTILYVVYIFALILFALAISEVMQIYQDHADLKARVVAYETMRHEQSKVEAIGRTLELAYGLSEQEAWTIAQIYAHFARTYCYEWTLYASIRAVEYDHNNHYGEHGEVGEYQVLETTAAEVCSLYAIPYKKGKTLHRDILNIWIGCLYLTTCMIANGEDAGIRRYNGSGEITKEYLTRVRGEQAKVIEIYRRIKGE